MSLHYDHRLIPRAKELRKTMTKQEKKLWYDFLRIYPIRFQRQKTIDRFIVDFYCAGAKLAVEIDGSRHFTEEGKTYDSERTSILNSYLVEVMRFSNSEIDSHFDAVCKTIDNKVKDKC